MMELTMVTMAKVCRVGRNQNSPIWRMNMTAKVVRRPIVYDIHAQKTRPNALPMLTTPTMPEGTMAVAFVNSWNIGASCEMMEMPAEVLRSSSSHSAHHCHVFNAWPRVKSLAFFCTSCFSFGVHPSGFQPAGGFCIK